MELIRRCKTKFQHPIPPVTVEAETAPVNENWLPEEKVDVRPFPAARHWPRDGGEYIGTCDAIITRDPDGGWLNVGTYRQMVQGKNQVGLYLSPGKDARLHIERYWSRNEPCEVVCCWGIDPALFIAASQTFPKTVSELDFVGGMLGRPVELVKGAVTSLLYPAHVEIAVEGVIPPHSQKLEGPFGDDDVDPSNTNQVIWAMSTRCNPSEDIDILRQTWSTWLDPTQNPPEERPYGSKALINACMEHRYVKTFSPRTKLRRSVYERVAARWRHLGLDGAPPTPWALEDQ
jgi:3-polyprenyl-4-hydroxybenzoate decarboxylase